MNGCRWSGLALGIMILTMVPLTATSKLAQRDHAWPGLLANRSLPVDPHIAAMQSRAHDALQRLMRSADASRSIQRQTVASSDEHAVPVTTYAP